MLPLLTRIVLSTTQEDRPGSDKSTTKVSEDCIRFQEATDSTEDYILILDGVNVCNRELERTGGEQVIKSIK